MPKGGLSNRDSLRPHSLIASTESGETHFSQACPLAWKMLSRVA